MKCDSFEYFVLGFHTEDLWTTELTTLLKKETWTFEKLDLPELVKWCPKCNLEKNIPLKAQEVIKFTSLVRNKFPA